MKELKLFSTAGIYQTPSCEILSVDAEGVLCGSVDAPNNGISNITGSDVNDESDDWI